MDKQLIERIALDARKEMAEVYGFWVSDLVARKLCALFLASIDAERGKTAVAKVCVHYNYGPDYKASVEWLTDCRLAPDTPIFISPTIPEGMAQDAERYRFIRMNRLWLKANLPLIAAPAFDEAIDAGLLAAAQGERNAD